MSEAIQLSRSAINFQLLLQFHLIHVCTVAHTVYLTIFVIAIHFLAIVSNDCSVTSGLPSNEDNGMVWYTRV